MSNGRKKTHSAIVKIVAALAERAHHMTHERAAEARLLRRLQVLPRQSTSIKGTHAHLLVAVRELAQMIVGTFLRFHPVTAHLRLVQCRLATRRR